MCLPSGDHSGAASVFAVRSSVSFLGVPPLTFITYRSTPSTPCGLESLTYTILVPSGDTAGQELIPVSFTVSRRTWVIAPLAVGVGAGAEEVGAAGAAVTTFVGFAAVGFAEVGMMAGVSVSPAVGPVSELP